MVGRDEAEVAARRERWADFIPQGGALVGTPDELVAIFREYARVGSLFLVFRAPDWNDVESVQLFADKVIPALANA